MVCSSDQRLHVGVLMQHQTSSAETSAWSSTRHCQTYLVDYLIDKLFAGKVSPSRLIAISKATTSVLSIDVAPVPSNDFLHSATDDVELLKEGGWTLQSLRDLAFVKVLIHALSMLESGSRSGSGVSGSWRAAYQILTDNKRLASRNLMSLTGQAACHGRAGLAKKAYEFVANLSVTFSTPEEDLAVIAAARGTLNALGDVPQQHDEAFDVLADWSNTRAEEIQRAAMALVEADKIDATAHALAKGLISDILPHLLHFGCSEPVYTLLGSVDSIVTGEAAQEDAVNDLQWAGSVAGIVCNLADVAYQRAWPPALCLLPIVRDYAAAVSDLLAMLSDDHPTKESEYEARLVSWKAMIDKWRLLPQEAPNTQDADSRAADDADGVSFVALRKLVGLLRAVSATNAAGGFVERAVAHNLASSLFVKSAEEFQLRLPTSTQGALACFRVRESLDDAARRLASGGTLSILELGSTLDGAFKYYPDAFKKASSSGSDNVGEQVAKLKKHFDMLFGELLKKCNVPEALALHSKYNRILVAATSWDFADCSFVYPHDGDEAMQSDATALDSFCVNLGTSIHILRSVIGRSTFSELSQQAQGTLTLYDESKKSLDELPEILGKMMLCSVLVKTKTSANQTELSRTVRYVERRLSLPRKKFGQVLDSKIKAYGDGAVEADDHEKKKAPASTETAAVAAAPTKRMISKRQGR